MIGTQVHYKPQRSPSAVTREDQAHSRISRLWRLGAAGVGGEEVAEVTSVPQGASRTFFPQSLSSTRQVCSGPDCSARMAATDLSLPDGMKLFLPSNSSGPRDRVAGQPPKPLDSCDEIVRSTSFGPMTL